MRIKVFTGYHRYGENKMSFQEAQEQINEFISDKDVVDIKVASSRDEYDYPIFQYTVMYKEILEEKRTEIKVGDRVKVIARDKDSYGTVGYVAYIDKGSPVPYYVVYNRAFIGLTPSAIDYRRRGIFNLESLELCNDENN